jgi:uncharacterized protein YqjF (DUF2071 family)
VTLPRAVLRQDWVDVGFLHWATHPSAVAPLLPRGTEPDLFEGRTYVGLVGFRMRQRFPPYGWFAEVNVRLYSVDGAGRHGVVFRSLDASRGGIVLAGRAVGLPYHRARMRVGGGELTSRRRRGGAGCRAVLATGDPITPSPLEDFLTARYGLHWTVAGRTAYWPNTHPPWPLHRARLLELRQDLVEASGPPDSVLFSPGVTASFGPPMMVR